MAKLTKQQVKLHEDACKVLEKDELTFEDKWYVLENWNEGAKHMNSSAGAFFTPIGLARDFSIEVTGKKIIDLCAGIGTLSFMYYHSLRNETPPDITCVEINPDYVEVGKKILPEAQWICADIFDDTYFHDWIGKFDTAISNPPFGRSVQTKFKRDYTGADFEYKVIDAASWFANHGVFIIPQMSAGFHFSGVQCFEKSEAERYKKFVEQTGIELEPGCGIDTSFYQNDWKGVFPKTEVVLAEFGEIGVAL